MWGLGQALYRLGRRTEALQHLGRALELQKSIEEAAPEQLWLLRSTSRAHMVMGNVLLQQGDTERALANYREGLSYAERSFKHFSSSLSLELDRAELLEAIGAYYLALTAQPGAGDSRRAELKEEARSWYQKSLAIWRDWASRKVAVPYAERRMSRTLSVIASMDRP
jgi:tetratricopeptide (TPR) repeat protein